MTNMNIAEYEKINPLLMVEGIYFYVPTQRCLWRAQTLLNKEPDTLEWISTFGKNDVFIDIGANVGVFTLWAAMKQGATVYAFEPESQNYSVLCRNIAYNNLDGQVAAFCVAISDQQSKNGGVYFDRLNMGSFAAGASGSNFGAEVDFKNEPATPLFRQGCLCVGLDDFLENTNLDKSQSDIHIKIDVDGIEHRVINSARKSLKSSRIKSVLIEINTNMQAHNQIIDQMEHLGFETSIHPDAIEKEGNFKGIGNHIFKRKKSIAAD